MNQSQVDEVIDKAMERNVTARVSIFGRSEIISGTYMEVMDKVNEYCAIYGRITVSFDERE